MIMMDLERFAGFMYQQTLDQTSVERVIALAERFEAAASITLPTPTDEIRIRRVIEDSLNHHITWVIAAEPTHPRLACQRLHLPMGGNGIDGHHLWRDLFQACHSSKRHSVDGLVIDRYHWIRSGSNEGNGDVSVGDAVKYWVPSCFFMRRLLTRIANRIGSEHWLIQSEILERELDYYGRHLFPILIWAGLKGNEHLLDLFIPLAELLLEAPLLGMIRNYALVLRI